MAAGSVPEDALPEVMAYLDWRAFGALPGAGGTLDQPAWLLDGMRVIHAAVLRAEARRAKKAGR